jgi:hypothetical protein
MNAPDSISREFDLSPHPRILPMLGEITMAEWRCLAELVDNAVDAFLSAYRAGSPVERPEIVISIPTSATPNGRITVRDNGPGMEPTELENAVRAGWTSRDPMHNLGLFGMGFNIATARLGSLTRVWTARREDTLWHGLVIDFNELVRTGSFRTPMVTRPKADPHESGTEVWVEKLKPEPQEFFAKTANRSRVLKELGRVYSAMLRPNGVPIQFFMTINNTKVGAREHCVWGSPGESRHRELPGIGLVHSVETFNHPLGDRPFCTKCWEWLSRDEHLCRACGSDEHVVIRSRRVRGWVGIQRYLDENDYGLDFLRNGRKIEIANRDLFAWDGPDGSEEEYPIDDPRHRGRIVGEIHLDHCRVPYTKDRFDRNDPAWEEMVRLIRGEGPLRPETAAQAGFGPNISPLFRLFQAFRRSTPRRKVAGWYTRLLLVPDNERSKDMAKRFHAGEAEYQRDTKWWELAEEADRQQLTGAVGTPRVDGVVGGAADEFWGPPSGGGDPPPGTSHEGSGTTSPIAPVPVPPHRDQIASLTREYRDEQTNLRWEVDAYAVGVDDPELENGARPWALRAVPEGSFKFFVNTRHPVFASATMTPVDGLLAELAWHVMDSSRGTASPPAYGSVLAGLRLRYAVAGRLDPVFLSAEANSMLRSVARSLGGNVDAADAQALFDDLSIGEREATLTRLSARAGAAYASAISEGRWLEFAPRQSIVRVFARNPELFFDGRFWNVPYEEIDFGDPHATSEFKSRLVRNYSGMLDDAVWLAEQDAEDLAEASRERLLRAALALDLLAIESRDGDAP